MNLSLLSKIAVHWSTAHFPGETAPVISAVVGEPVDFEKETLFSSTGALPGVCARGSEIAAAVGLEDCFDWLTLSPDEDGLLQYRLICREDGADRAGRLLSLYFFLDALENWRRLSGGAVLDLDVVSRSWSASEILGIAAPGNPPGLRKLVERLAMPSPAGP